MIKLIASDIDGTLINSKSECTAATIEAITKAREQGMKFAICSGRPVSGIKPLLKGWHLEDLCDYIVGMNGGEVLNVKENKFVSCYPLDRDIILDLMDEYEPMGYIPTYYDDARDYSPYTTIEIFLPFIGIRRLNAEDVIGCTVSVKYVIDVYTGCILCNITVNKNGASQVLYTFSGNCSVQIPLTGADRTRLLSGALSGTLIGLTGGAAGAMGGAVLGGLTSGTSIERSSNFGGNAGAMGIKIPYVIVNRKIGVDATDYNRQYGFPVNTSILLNDCQGYTRVKDVHVENINNATVDEKNEIERLLKSGVIIS